MTRIILILGILATVLQAGDGLPRIALVDIATMNITPAETRQVAHATRLALVQAGIFRLITEEEMLDAFLVKGESSPPACFSESCHANNANILGADILAFIQVFRQGNAIHISVLLRKGVSGKLIERKQYSRICVDDADLTGLARSAIAQTLGVGPAQELGISLDSTAIHPGTTKWIGGAVIVGAGFALAGFINGGGFLQKDNNSLDSGFSYNRDGTYNLSGIQGFFFGSRLPHSRIRALGGSGVSLTGGNGTEQLNPAGVAGLQHSQVSFSTATLPAGSGEQFTTTWSAPYGQGMWWTHGIRFEGDDLASEFSFSSGLAVDFSLLSNWLTGIIGGVRVKAFSMQAGAAGEGLARSTGNGIGGGFDLGLQWQIWNGPRLGIYGEDLWSQVKYHNTLTGRTYYEGLPTTLTLGTSWESPTNTLLSLDLRKGVLRGQKDRLMIGMEQRILEVLQVRGGCYQVLGTPTRMWSLGAGAKASSHSMSLEINLAIEMASQPYDVLAQKRILSMMLEF